MQLTLRQQLTQFAHLLQTSLFPVVEQEVGELSETAKRLIATLSMIPLARFVPASRGWMGRPCKDRLAIARAFVADDGITGRRGARDLAYEMLVGVKDLLNAAPGFRGREGCRIGQNGFHLGEIDFIGKAQ